MYRRSMFAKKSYTLSRQDINTSKINNMPKLVYMCDGNNVLHRAKHGYAKLNLKRNDGMPTTIIYGMLHIICSTIDKFNVDCALITFDGEGKNWRHDIYPDYKVSRVGEVADDGTHMGHMEVNDLQQLHAIKVGLKLLGLKVLHRKHTEADDLLATYARMLPLNYHGIIDTNDKDIMQLVDWRVKVWSGVEKQLYGVKEVEARLGVPPSKIHAMLSLGGDSIDDIPKCPGVTVEKVVYLLNKYHTLEAFMKDTDIDPSDLKYRAKIQAFRGQWKINRQITALVDVEDVPYSIEDLHIGKPNAIKLKEWLSLYEIKKVPDMVTRVLNGVTRTKPMFG